MLVSENNRVRKRLNSFLDNSLMVNVSDLSKKMGVSRATLVQFKNNKRDVNVETLRRIEKFLERNQ